MTPVVAQQKGHTGWALFTDSDWLWLDDINKRGLPAGAMLQDARDLLVKYRK